MHGDLSNVPPAILAMSLMGADETTAAAIHAEMDRRTAAAAAALATQAGTEVHV